MNHTVEHYGSEGIINKICGPVIAWRNTLWISIFFIFFSFMWTDRIVRGVEKMETLEKIGRLIGGVQMGPRAEESRPMASGDSGILTGA